MLYIMVLGKMSLLLWLNMTKRLKPLKLKYN